MSSSSALLIACISVYRPFAALALAIWLHGMQSSLTAAVLVVAVMNALVIWLPVIGLGILDAIFFPADGDDYPDVDDQQVARVDGHGDHQGELPAYFADDDARDDGLLQPRAVARYPPAYDDSDDEDDCDPDFDPNRPALHWPPPLDVNSAVDASQRSVPPEFICPISFQIMRLPTQTPMGTTYDFAPLAEWIDVQHRYPANEATGTLTREGLVPNFALRNVIARWLAENPPIRQRRARSRPRS
jgi:hypothetical protein